jgi:Ca2+-binding RTX toxin-like protein
MARRIDRTRSLRHARRPVLEAMEGRQLLSTARLLDGPPSVTAMSANDVLQGPALEDVQLGPLRSTARLQNGQLIVTGTSANDVLHIRNEFRLVYDPDLVDLVSQKQVVAYADLASGRVELARHPQATVARIVIHGLGGNDDLRNYTDTPSTMEGGAGNDTLVGGHGDDDLYGDSSTDPRVTGNDVIKGLGGNDRIWGGPGNDWIEGGDGNDWSHGGPGNDSMFGGAGNDRFDGNEGDDLLDGGEGDDALWGGPGNDVIYGGRGRDSLYGGLGDDRIDGDGNAFGLQVAIVGSDWQNGFFHFADYIEGGPGADWLKGNLGDDTILGGDGNDEIFGGAGHDSLDGGNGNDWLFGGDGDDSLYGRAGNDYLYGGAGNDTLYGNAGNDCLFGEAGSDHLEGGVGDDSLYGGSGDDHLDGGDGNDYLDGGNDDDRLIGGNGWDKIYTGAGQDVVLTDNSRAEEDGVEYNPYDFSRADKVYATGNGNIIFASRRDLVRPDGSEIRYYEDMSDGFTYNIGISFNAGLVGGGGYSAGFALAPDGIYVYQTYYWSVGLQLDVGAGIEFGVTLGGIQLFQGSAHIVQASVDTGYLGAGAAMVLDDDGNLVGFSVSISVGLGFPIQVCYGRSTTTVQRIGRL